MVTTTRRSRGSPQRLSKKWVVDDRLPEQAERHRLGEHAVSGRVQVQVVTDVRGGQESPRIGRIAHGGVEVDDRVEAAARADPAVDGLPGRLAQAAGIVVAAAAEPEE